MEKGLIGHPKERTKMDHFSRLLDAFSSELELWPPSEQSFDESLTKAKLHSCLEDIKLSPAQSARLRSIYEDERIKERHQ